MIAGAEDLPAGQGLGLQCARSERGKGFGPGLTSGSCADSDVGPVCWDARTGFSRLRESHFSRTAACYPFFFPPLVLGCREIRELQVDASL